MAWHMYTYTACTHIYICIDDCLYIHMYTHIHMYVYIYICKYTHKYMYAHIYGRLLLDARKHVAAVATATTCIVHSRKGLHCRGFVLPARAASFEINGPK